MAFDPFSLIGPVLSFFGDKKSAQDQAQSAERQQQANLEAQREFAQHGIRWKVEDAKAAGLHPLYAIGSAGASYAPNPITVTDGMGKAMANMGQNVSNAIARSQTQEEHRMRELQEELLKAQIDQTRAHADYYRAQSPLVTPGVSVFPYTGTRNQDTIPGYPLPPKASGRDNANAVVGGQFDKVSYKPSEHKSARSKEPHVTAGIGPALSEYQLTPSRSMLLPHTFSDDAEIPVAMLPAIVQANVQKYGLLNTARAFGFGEGQTDDPISRWLTTPGRFSRLNPRGQGRFSSLNK